MNKIKRLLLALSLTFSVFLVELLGGFFTNSVALVSDALHMLTDVLALVLSISALVVATKKPNLKSTYGYHRIEIFVALINGISVFALAIVILYEGIRRVFMVEHVATFEMIIIAFIGLGANIASARILMHSTDLNVRSVYLHVIGDALSSIAVVTGGIIMFFTGVFLIDAILSMCIAFVIMYSAGGLINDAVGILLERAPKHLNTAKIIAEMKTVKGVLDVHDVRLWSVCSNVHAMSAHIVVPDMKVSETKKVIDALNSVLERYNIFLTSFQAECMNCGKETVCEIEHCDIEDEH
jgi:cobalt-zinc-cadmium efflux system protein